MNCNCNNENNKTALIKHVFGNVLRLAIPLTLRTVSLEDGEIVSTDTDFIPSNEHPVRVEFAKEKGITKVVIDAVMRDGNVACVEDEGTIPIGTYAITVTCKDNNAKPYRFKQRTVLTVTDYTADAGIQKPVEFEVKEWYLDAAIFLALKGEDGVGIQDIETQTSTEVGGVNTITFILTDGRTRSFTVLNGSGNVDDELDINSRHPLSNSAITTKFNAIDEELANIFGDVDYESRDKVIRFWDKGKTKILAALDATPFIKDGMVNSVYISNNTLVITFNTESGKEPIGVPLTSVFNPNNYYNKTQVDNRIASAVAGVQIDTSGLAQLATNSKLRYNQSAVVILDHINGVEGEDVVYPTSPGIIFGAENGHIILVDDDNEQIDLGITQDIAFYDKTTEAWYRYSFGAGSFDEMGWHQISAGGGSGGGGVSEETDPVFRASVAATITQAMINTWNAKQAAINDLDAIRAGAALGATALQSFTESDPTVPAWAKQPDKPTYNVAEIIYSSNRYSSNRYLSSKLAEMDAEILAAGATDSEMSESSTKPVQNKVIKAYIDAVSARKVSDLENDEGFVTAQDVAGIVASTGDLTIVESSNYIDIFISHPELTVTALTTMSASTKSGTFKVSGSHLKGDVTISTSATNWTLSADGGTTTSQSLTLSPTDGTLAETTITVAYSGTDDSTGNTITVASTGAVSATVTASYTQYSGPTIIADNSLTVKTGAGSTNTATLSVQGVNLEGNITAAISGTDAGKFSVSGSPITQSSGSASGTLTITYSPAAGDSGTHTATLTLSSTNATSVVVTLNGAVSSLTVSVDSLSLSTDQGVSTTGTFTVSGANLREDVSVSASGSYFSVSPATASPTSGTLASTTFTVTYNPSASGSHSGTITIQSSGVSKTISLSGTAAAATTSDENGQFTKDINGKTIYFGRISDGNGGFTDDVAVYQKGYGTSSQATSANRYSGDIAIPATVACDGTTYNVTTIESYAFGGCGTGITVDLPEGLTTIKANAFRASKLTSIVIPSTVTTIGQYAFYDMSALTTVDMRCAQNQNFQTGWDCIFAKSSALTSLVIPDKVTGFVNNSFITMKGLLTLTFGTDLATFNAVFNGNGAPNVTTVICRGTTTIPHLASGQTFDSNFTANATIYVPNGYKQAYIDNANWVGGFNTAGRLKEMSEFPSND